MSDHRLRIQTLGSFIIERDNEVIETFLTRKTALLLVYLALHPSKHSREKLASLFWSETTDEQALKNLRTILSSIRKNAPLAVQITRQVIQIGENVWIDAREFEDGCDAIFAGDKRSLDAMMELIQLYTGEFLSDVHVQQVDSLQDWLDNKRDQLHQKYLQLLYHVGAHCLETGNLYIGVDLARQLITMNPLWEAAHRQLMMMLAHLGQTGEAQMQYERLVTLIDEELGATPEQETLSLYESVKSGASHPPKAPLPRIVLPDILYIPPRHDLAALRQMLDKPDTRLITLIGMSGVGKTMLATFIAHERQTLYKEEVTFISLANVKDEQALPQHILSSLKVEIKRSASEEQLLSELRTRKLLLVLDNYEQLLPQTDLIQRILVEAPGVRLLVTSQVALNLRQEWLLRLSGLNVQADEAIRLFKRTTERMLPQFDFTPYEDDIRQICLFLDGLPIGIVIASSQMKVLTPPQILAVLRDDVLSLASPYADMPTRHQGFANLVSTILKQLPAEDHRALMALALFPDSFAYEAALAVANIDMGAFIRLVDKSLIQKGENFRYRIHGLLRQIFLEQLNKSNEQEHARQRLTAYYVQWSHNLYRQNKQRDDDILTIESEHDNIWHLELLNEYEQQQYLLEIIPALQKYWRNRGFGEKVVALLLPALDDDRHPIPLRARAMVELATIMVHLGQQTQAQALCERAVAFAPDILYVQVDALQNLARLDMQRGQNEQAWQRVMEVLELESQHTTSEEQDPMLDSLFIGNHTGIGLIAMNIGELGIARSHFNIALHSWTQMEKPLMQAQLQNNLALLDMREGHYDSARQHFEAVLPVFREAGDDGLLSTLHGNLGRALMMVGDYAQAHTTLTEAIRVAVRLKRKVSILYQMETFTQLAFLMDQHTIAAQLYGYIVRRSEDDKIAFWSITLERMNEYSAQMQAILGSRFELLVNLGSQLSQDAAVALAESLSSYLH